MTEKEKLEAPLSDPKLTRMYSKEVWYCASTVPDQSGEGLLVGRLEGITVGEEEGWLNVGPKVGITDGDLVGFGIVGECEGKDFDGNSTK